MNRQLLILSTIAIAMTGCQSNQPQQPLFGAAAPGYSQGYANNGSAIPGRGFTPDNSQFQQSNQNGSLNSQIRQFDSDNQNLHTQVAALQQRLQNANSYNDQLKQQLSDQMSQLQQARALAQKQATLANNTRPQGVPGYQNAGYQTGQPNTTGGNTSTRFTGATIRANSGLTQKIQVIQLPGYKTWMDGDVIRIEGPTDRLFVSGTYQLNGNDAMTMTNLASIIRQNFPRQVIGVEAYWDGTAIQPATTSHHQLTATQALAVFDVLVKSGLPHKQVFTMAMGSNRMRYPAGNPANRRIEIVIYPETF